MKKYLFNIVLMALAFSFTGCATLNNPNLSAQEKAQRIYDQDSALIQTAVGLVTQGVQFSYERVDPAGWNDIKTDIISMTDKISRSVDAARAVAGGTITPAQLVGDLKVRDDNVTRVLQSFVPVYSQAYADLKNNSDLDAAKLSLDYVKLLVDGVRSNLHE